MGRAPHIQARVDRFAELLSRDMPIREITGYMGLTKGEAAATMRRIREDLGPQADVGRKYRCGHPATPENTVGRIKHRCRTCTRDARQVLAAMTPKEEKRLDYRVRILPEQLDRARRRLKQLEAEAMDLGMTDLLASQ